MTAKEFKSRGLWNKPVDRITMYACEILERRGQRFLIDFGYENAKQKAADLLCAELEI